MIRVFLVLLLIFEVLVVLPVMAEEPTPADDQPPAGTNPTDVRTRGDLKYMFIKAQSGAELNALTARLDYAITSDLLLRVDIPYLNVDPQVAGIDDETGLGDLFVRLGWRVVNKPEYALFLGGDFIVDTASEDILGGGTTKAIPLVAVAAPGPSYKGLAALVCPTPLMSAAATGRMSARPRYAHSGSNPCGKGPGI